MHRIVFDEGKKVVVECGRIVMIFLILDAVEFNLDDVVVRDAVFAQGCAEERIEQIGFSTAADASDDFDEPVSLARDELF